ncbi:hypothetical protein BDR07DRAFT_1493058 [Suillus spraguei]|nr:hypothetical protein BDR07DRAFT_1493058 [Suillus spraguei]
MPSMLTSPGSKATTVRRKCFNPYVQPSPCIKASSNQNLETITAPLVRRFAMCFNEDDVHLGQDTLNAQLVWMGSTMLIDEPELASGTLGNAQDASIQSPDVAGNQAFQAPISMANVANNISSSHTVEHLSSKKRELARSLQKAINKIYAALESILLGMEVEDILLRHYSKGTKKPKTDDNGQGVQQ